MNARRLLPLTIAAAAALSLAACGSDSASSSTTSAGTTAPAAASSTAAPTTTGAMTAPATGDAVSIGAFVFEPAELHVAVGTAVTWTNTHDQPHTATSAGNFDTGAIQPGESASVTFDKAGTFSYICSFHPFMTGAVVVG